MINSFLITGASTKATIRWRMCKFIRLAFDEAMNSSSEQRGRLEIHLERRWSFGPIRYNDQVVKLSGYPSYVLWYGGEDDMALNVMVAQDERFGESDKGIAEVLGYLGKSIVLYTILCVHQLIWSKLLCTIIARMQRKKIVHCTALQRTRQLSTLSDWIMTRRYTHPTYPCERAIF